MDGRYQSSINAERQAIRLDAIVGRFDGWLLLCVFALVSVGLVMVASSSLAVAESRNLAPLYYFYRHVAYVVVGVLLMLLLMYRSDIRQLEQYGKWLPIIGALLLLLVLVPGLGHTVKGARRWVNLGPIGFQPAEAIKLIMIVWLASYLARFSDEVKGSWLSMLKAFTVSLSLSLLLLLIHKDFGTTALVLAITAGMLVLGGVNMPRMIMPAVLLLPLLGLFILLEPYRMQRLISFRDPWQDPFGDGYQLTNALMAVGRGEFWGVGLGGSVQKLNYLPEAYTDFIMAVLAEELGFVGVCLVVSLYALLIGRALWLGLQCVEMRRNFSGYLCFGIALWIAMQAFISIGVNLGILPTKGLTLPLISFGGSSILVTFTALGLLLRVSWELERAKRQVALRREMALQSQAAVAVPEALVSASPAPVSGEVRKHAVENRTAKPGRVRSAPLLQRMGEWMRSRSNGARRESPRQRIEPSFGGLSGQ